jgi:hypothetical protein
VGEESEPRVERYPGEDEVESVLNNGEAREDDKVDQPWGQLSRIRSVQCFVGSEDGKQDRGRDAVSCNELSS